MDFVIDTVPAQAVNFGQPLTTDGEGLALDADGLAIPQIWRGSPTWPKLPYGVRKRKSDAYLADLSKPTKEASTRTYAKRFTTDYAIAWGRAQGWKLREREAYDFRNKHHHDLALGSDAKFETETDFVFIQGAGRGERKAHFTRFETRGGIPKARKMNARFVYLEFARGDKKPLIVEWWA